MAENCTEDFNVLRNECIEHITYITENILVKHDDVENSLFTYKNELYDNGLINKQFNMYTHAKDATIAIEIGFNSGFG